MITFPTQHKLERIGRRVRLDRDFEATMRKQFEQSGYLQPSYAFPTHWKTAAASVGSVFCLLTGTATYAYASDSVIPQTTLYPVRIAVEQVEVQLAQTPQKKGLVALKHLRRRVSEAAKLQALNRQIPESHRQALKAGVSLEGMKTETTLTDEDRFAAEAVQLESRELSEMLDQQEMADTDEERTEIREQILEKADNLEGHIDRLEKRRRSSLEENADKTEGDREAVSND